MQEAERSAQVSWIPALSGWVVPLFRAASPAAFTSSAARAKSRRTIWPTRWIGRAMSASRTTGCCCTCSRRISSSTGAPAIAIRSAPRARASRRTFTLVTASAHEHEALVDAVHQAHLAVEETVFEPVAAAYAAIMQEDRARGVALVDIGAHSTDLVVYDGEAMLLATSLPYRATTSRATSPTSSRFRTKTPRVLKREYGCAMLGLTADNSLIEVPSPEDARPSRGARGAS